MKMKLLLLLAWPFSLMAQNQTDSLFIRKLADEVLVRGQAYENLRVLCKSVGPRLSGSPGMYKAEAWAEKALQSAGADEVLKQACMVPFWERGAPEKLEIEFVDERGKKVRQRLDAISLGNAVGTGGKPLVAPLVLIKSFEDLEKQGAAVKGKIVVFDNQFDARNINTGKSYGESGLYRRQGPSRAAKYGAVGVLIRSVSGSTDNHPHTGTTTYDSAYAKIPAAAMGLQDAAKVISLLEKGVSITGSYTSQAQMHGYVEGHNIIGIWRGSTNPEQIITVGGHLDSWDPAEGAHDDGAGCVHSIEVLRALKAAGYRPKHTIRIVLFANEENGLRGGTQYAMEAKRLNEQHLFALESDAGGFTPRGFGTTMSAAQLQTLRSWLPLFLPYGVYEFTAGGGGADIGPLNRQLGTPLAGYDPDDQRYFDVHHARSDVFENVHKRELELGALNMAILIYLVDKYGL
jgi:carboxypeptidase Q